jgi:hypothetical protein
MSDSLIVNEEQAKKDIDGLMIASIEANAYSLRAQLEEYSFLKITSEQSKRLNEIEYNFHKLVQEITVDYNKPEVTHETIK